MENSIAIIAVAYNRKDSLQRLLNSLESAYYADEHPTLIISIDKSDTDIVERYADSYVWPYGQKIVKKHQNNLGLRNHMISLGQWFDVYDTLIVLEDDIVVSTSFYLYTRQTSDKYYNNDKIAGISLYAFEMNYHTCTPFIPIKDQYDIYFMNTAMSWGEVWMKSQWLQFYDWYLTHQDFTCQPYLPESICKWEKSWLKYHTRYCIESDLYFVYPYTSLSSNCGDVGTHNNNNTNNEYQVSLQQGVKLSYFLPDTLAEATRYDGFFENKTLYDKLALEESECCIDTYGIRKNKEHKRYWLTTCKASYPILKSFAMKYKPIELNVINNSLGNDIFLYDVKGQKNTYSTNPREVLQRYNISDITVLIRKYGIINVLFDFMKLFYKRFSK